MSKHRYEERQLSQYQVFEQILSPCHSKAVATCDLYTVRKDRSEILCKHIPVHSYYHSVGSIHLWVTCDWLHKYLQDSLDFPYS